MPDMQKMHAAASLYSSGYAADVKPGDMIHHGQHGRPANASRPEYPDHPEAVQAQPVRDHVRDQTLLNPMGSPSPLADAQLRQQHGGKAQDQEKTAHIGDGGENRT